MAEDGAGQRFHGQEARRAARLAARRRFAAGTPRTAATQTYTRNATTPANALRIRPTGGMNRSLRSGYARYVPRRRDIDRLQGEIEELFADLWQVPRFSGLRRGFRPSVDCVRIEDPPALQCTFELAGIQAADIRIDATSTSLSVRGVRRRPAEARQVLQVEIEIGPFERHLRLPEEVDVEHATARLDHGFLTIVLPIAQRPLAPVKVPIEVDVP